MLQALFVEMGTEHEEIDTIRQGFLDKWYLTWVSRWLIANQIKGSEGEKVANYSKPHEQK